MIDINLVNRKLVKPCTPTPQSLQTYKLSFTDEFVVLMDMEVGVLLFYADADADVGVKVYEDSLSKVLVQFYPLAGRYVMKDRYVDCSDQGAELVEAEAPDVDVDMATLIKERDIGNLAGFFPRKSHQVDEATYPLLSIQITKLKSCGGVVIGISISHKIFDASSLSTFIASWSSVVKDEIMTFTPIFNSSSLFPLCKDRNNYIPAGLDVLGPIADISRVSVKRFTFNKEAISKLRSNLRPTEGKRGWSKVRVVSSFIAKVLLGVDRTIHDGTSRPCLIAQVANIRERTIPPLPRHSCGNLVLTLYHHCMDTRDMGIQEFADEMGEDIDKCVANCSLLLSLGEDGLHKLIVDPVMKALESLQSGKTNLLFFTDWSKFGFYEADFGWGKPVWASIIPIATEKGVVLMPSEEGNGIEAWVYLEKNDMVLFEQDDEIKLLANLAI